MIGRRCTYQLLCGDESTRSRTRDWRDWRHYFRDTSVLLLMLSLEIELENAASTYLVWGMQKLEILLCVFLETPALCSLVPTGELVDTVFKKSDLER